MATLKQRLHRKNASGTFDTIHLETSSNLVVRDSGGTVEDYLPQIVAGDAVPGTLNHGTIMITNDRVYIGDSNNQPMEVVTITHELNIGTINGLTIEQILDKMAEKKIGIYPGSGSEFSQVFTGDIILGNVVTMVENNMAWRIVHIDRSLNEVVLMKELHEENVAFSSVSNSQYTVSSIAEKCAEFYNQLPEIARNKLLNKVSHDVLGKVWIPASNWISGQSDTVNTGSGSWERGSGAIFDYFTDTNSNSGERIFYDAYGTPQKWWTNACSNTNSVYSVSVSGSIVTMVVTGLAGFRPFIAVPM